MTYHWSLEAVAFKQRDFNDVVRSSMIHLFDSVATFRASLSLLLRHRYSVKHQVRPQVVADGPAVRPRFSRKISTFNIKNQDYVKAGQLGRILDYF